jgi:hypothetical protein
MTDNVYQDYLLSHNFFGNESYSPTVNNFLDG